MRRACRYRGTSQGPRVRRGICLLQQVPRDRGAAGSQTLISGELEPQPPPSVEPDSDTVPCKARPDQTCDPLTHSRLGEYRDGMLVGAWKGMDEGLREARSTARRPNRPVGPDCAGPPLNRPLPPEGSNRWEGLCPCCPRTWVQSESFGEFGQAVIGTRNQGAAWARR